MLIYTLYSAVARSWSFWGKAIGGWVDGDKKNRMSELGREMVGCGHSSDKLKKLEDMTAGTALDRKLDPVEIRLQSLADAPVPLTAANVDLLREVGLGEEEIRSFVSQDLGGQYADGNGLTDGNRLRNLAGLLAQCFRLYGVEGGLRWLRQPLARFGQKSPLGFLQATTDFDSVDEYLVQIAEGYFA